MVAGSKVYFVPIDAFSEQQMQHLVHYYHDKFDLDVEVLQSIPVDTSLVNASRRQLRAEKVVARVHAAFPDLARDPKNILIGFTSHDIYPESQDWRFAFGWRIPELSAAVVSTAVMNVKNPRVSVEVAAPEVRLRKVVTKDLGILYYGLPVNNNPKSVLYNQILGIRELDSVGEDF